MQFFFILGLWQYLSCTLCLIRCFIHSYFFFYRNLSISLGAKIINKYFLHRENNTLTKLTYKLFVFGIKKTIKLPIGQFVNVYTFDQKILLGPKFKIKMSNYFFVRIVHNVLETYCIWLHVYIQLFLREIKYIVKCLAICTIELVLFKIRLFKFRITC